MVRVKICGITSIDDAKAAIALGADAIGFVLADSPRQVSPDEVRRIISELPALVVKVGVFVDESEEKLREMKDYCGLDMIQLHGDEPESLAARLGTRAIKAVRVGQENKSLEDMYRETTLLLDTYQPGIKGGTGKTFDWRLATEVAKKRPIILAGGLNPDNVIEAIERVNPYAVDVSSGVESQPGRKDHDKLASFIRRVKGFERSA